VRDEIEQYRSHDVRPFGVNPAAATSHASYARKLELPFILLSDPGRQIASAYGAVRLGGLMISRSVVLVDRDGTVLFAAPGAPGAPISLEGIAP
jgi:thioredoxin-dependent peroxiredoxin